MVIANASCFSLFRGYGRKIKVIVNNEYHCGRLIHQPTFLRV